MRLPRSRFAVTAAVLATLSACTDPPSSPEATRTAPRAPSLDAAPTAAVTFTRIEDLPNAWVERFNVNNPDPLTWTVAPKYWVTTDALTMSRIEFDIAPATSISAETAVPNSLDNWAIVRQVRDRSSWNAPESMTAWHDGSTCNSPPASHTVASFDEVPFLCRNHMMTATNAGTATPDAYAVTYLTPDRLIDFSSGNTFVRFDVATLRSSGRDWIDLWITPYGDNLVVPLDDSLPDAQGYPRNGLHLRMTSGDVNSSRFEASLIVNHRAFRIPPSSTQTYEDAFRAAIPKPADPGAFWPTSPTRRDTFELSIGNGRFRFGMPRYNLWWYDIPLQAMDMGPQLLGVLQIGHHSFHPSSDGAPNTWHWDNIGIAPARQFSIINGDRRYVDATTTTINFSRPAPWDANLRFAGYGSKFEVRGYDASGVALGGWQKAKQQDEELDVKGRFHSYWTPVPPGTARVDFRADNEPSNKSKPDMWVARDATIWSLNP